MILQPDDRLGHGGDVFGFDFQFLGGGGDMYHQPVEIGLYTPAIVNR